MNGPHDLGGQMGFGPVAPEPHEPLFHEPSQRRAMGMTVAVGALGRWTLDESRRTRESHHPAEYYTLGYFGVMVSATERLLKRHGLVADDELAEGRPLTEPAGPVRVLKAEDVAQVLARGGPCDRPVSTPARFAVGQAVRARNIHPVHHTRLPRYVGGKVGTIEAVRGGFVFPDGNAHGKGENPEWLYTVAFAGTELWGDDSDPTLSVTVDAWESYLDHV